MEFLNDVVVAKVISFLYDQTYLVPILLLAGGLYFTIRSRFMQGRMFKEACSVIMEKPATENGISSFGALMVSTASRVGTGNIIGVSMAICMGGPGAIFWMWIVALIGGASAFVESTLAQIYKKKNDDGSSYGGPAYYMQQALKQRWLGVIFSILVIGTYAIGYNMLASYNTQTTFMTFGFYDEKMTPVIVGLVLAVLFGVVVIGGAKRLTKVTEFLVPIMGLIYVAVAIVVLILNFRHIPGMFGTIFRGAFDFHAIFGGFAGSCIMWGIKRGLYSNEAGMGSAPNAAATADVSHPAKQGLVQMLSVFIDTLLICTATALMCLSTNVTPNADIAGATYVQESMRDALGGFGPIFLTVAMSLFAYTTLIGNYSYCEGCLRFIIKRNLKNGEALAFRIFATVIVFVGAVATADLVWSLADMFQGLMVVTNVPSILILGGIAFACLRDYEKQKKQGLDPHFKAKDINLKQDVDFWQ